MSNDQSNTNPPFEKIGFGNVQIAIWKNTSAKGHMFYSLSIQNGYFDAKGNWNPSTSYSRDDMLVLAQASQLAFQRVHELQTADRALSRAGALAQEQVQQHTESPEPLPHMVAA